MRYAIAAVCVLLASGLVARAGFETPKEAAPVKLLLSEVQTGSLSSEHHCMLVFSDHRFHSERSIHKHGQEQDRKVYEGELSEPDWSALNEILDNKSFRELKVEPSIPPLVIEDVHAYTISVARDTEYQNMEFLTEAARKPYNAQVKPLLQWWKSARGKHLAESSAPADSRCELDSTHAVFGR